MIRWPIRWSSNAILLCVLVIALISVAQRGSAQSVAPNQRETQNHQNDPQIQKLLERLLAESAKPAPRKKDESEESSPPPLKPLPGMVAAFQIHGQPMRVGASGVRKVETEIKIQPTDLVHIGSCTKAMTATMVGRLVDQKKLSFDMTIQQGLPHLADQIHEDYHNVTLLQLLMHHGGVPREGMWGKQEGENVTRRRELIVVEALTNKPKDKPGTKFAYSNLGYVIAALMASHKEGKSWEELMQREIFDVLDMKSAGFGPPGTKGETDQPWGHLFLGKAVIPLQRDNPKALGPAGTVHLTMEDWAKFAFQHAGCAEPPIVSAETLKILHSAPTESGKKRKRRSDYYACGWTVTQRGWGKGRVLTHSGSNTLWFCHLWVAPKTRTVYMAVCNAGTAASIPGLVDRAISGMIELNLRK